MNTEEIIKLITKRYNQCIENGRVWDKQNKKGERKDWYQRFEYHGAEYAYKNLLNEIKGD